MCADDSLVPQMTDPEGPRLKHAAREWVGVGYLRCGCCAQLERQTMQPLGN